MARKIFRTIGIIWDVFCGLVYVVAVLTVAVVWIWFILALPTGA
jgi:hypothetical protein